MPELFEAAAGEEASVSLPNPPGTAAGLPGVNGRLPRNQRLAAGSREARKREGFGPNAERLLESASEVRPASDGGKPRKGASGFGRFARRVRKKERGLTLPIRKPGWGRAALRRRSRPTNGDRTGLAPAREPPAQRDAAPAGGPWSWDSGGRWRHRPPLRFWLQVVLGAGWAPPPPLHFTLHSVVSSRLKRLRNVP